MNTYEDTENWTNGSHMDMSLNYNNNKGNSLSRSMMHENVKSTLKTATHKATQFERYIVLATWFLMVISTVTIFSSFVLIKWYFMPNLYFWDNTFVIAPYMMLGMGLYTFLISIYGLLVKGLEKRRWFALYAVLLAVAFVGQLVSVYFIWQIRTLVTVGSVGATPVVESLNMYNINPEVTKSWDDMQTHMMCCGGNNWRQGYTDYSGTPIGRDGNSVPDSCCINPVKGCGRGVLSKSSPQIQEEIFVHGCVEILSRWMENEVNPLIPIYASVLLGVALVEIITVALASAYVAQITRRRHGDEIL